MKRKRNPYIFAPERPPKKHNGTLALLFLLLFAAVAGTLNAVNNGHVQTLTQRVTISSLPSALEGFSILHISDLHGARFGAEQVHLKTAIDSLSYKAVCITGDVVGKSGDVQPFLELLDAIAEDIPVFFIAGDEDPAPILTQAHGDTTVLAEYILQAQAHGAIYLDAPQKLTVSNQTLWIAPEATYSMDVDAFESALNARRAALAADGGEYDAENAAAIRAIDYQLDVTARIRAARAEMKETDTHIALTHHPLLSSTMRTLQQWSQQDTGLLRDIDLILAGHYNNGQWRLPFAGAIRAPAGSGLGNNGWWPEDAELTGLSGVLGIQQYISPGLGVSGAYPFMPFRLFNPPAVTRIVLTARLS